MRPIQSGILTAVDAAGGDHFNEYSTRPARRRESSPSPAKRIGIYASFTDLIGYGRPRTYDHRIERSLQFTDLRFGERIDRVEYGSPAWRAGLERGDVIVAFFEPRWGGDVRIPIRHHDHLREAISRSSDSIRLLVRNVRDGRYHKVTVRWRKSSPRPLIIH